MAGLRNYQTKTQLGQILVRKKLISEDQLARAMDQQASTGKRLGEILAEWNVITEQHIQSALRVQRNFRLAAAMATAVLAPLQTVGALAAPAVPTIQRSATETRTDRMVALSEEDLDGVSAQGFDSSLLDWIFHNARSNGGKVPMGELVKLMAPVLGFLDSDMGMKGVVYDASKAHATVNADGSVTLNVPSSIGELSFNNIRPRGSDGPSFGSITLSRIEFNNTTITLTKH
jgi:hypothetical protein